jgi:NitT/TauT family transport system permease protein
VEKLRKIIIFLILIIIWEVVAKLGVYPKTIFPAVSDVILELISAFTEKALLNTVIYSILILLKGIILTFIISFCLVLLSELNVWINDLLELFIIIMHPLPGIAIMPLVILWIGIGENAILFIILHAMLWPVIINLKSGINSINDSYIKMGKAFNFSFYKKLKHIYFMNLIPDLISGLKIAWARGWRALISSEMVFGVVGSTTGLGWYIFEQRVYMNTKGLYAGLFIIIILGFLVESLVFKTLEKNTLEKWGI